MISQHLAHATHAVRGSQIWKFFLLIVSVGKHACVCVWYGRIFANIFCASLARMYIRNSHKHLRSTIKSYRTNWKMLAHKLMLLLHRELIAVRIECVRHALSYIVLLTRNPSKTQNAYAHVHEWRRRRRRRLRRQWMPSVGDIFIRCVFFAFPLSYGKSFGYYYWFIWYRRRCCIISVWIYFSQSLNKPQISTIFAPHIYVEKSFNVRVNSKNGKWTESDSFFCSMHEIDWRRCTTIHLAAIVMQRTQKMISFEWCIFRSLYLHA